MELTEQQIIERLQVIFEKFLHENFSTNNSNVYFEKLITKLTDKENCYVLQQSFVLEWIDKCIKLLENDYESVNPKVTAFMLNTCSLMLQNEWLIITMREKRITDRLFTLLAIHNERFTPSIKLGYIRILNSITRISLGFAYIRLQKAWLYLIKLCNCDHTLYVVRDARKLLCELLYKFSVKAKDEGVVLEMLNEIIKPLHDNVYQDGSERIMINVDDLEIQHKVSSTLELLSYIFEQTLEMEEKTNLAHLCQKHHNIELTVWKLVEMTQDPGFLQKILHTVTSYNFATLVQDQWQPGRGCIESEKCSRFGVNFLNGMKFCISRQKLLNFVKLVELNHKLWKKLASRAPTEIQIEHERVRFENLLITFYLMPLLFILRKRLFFDAELFEDYLIRLFNVNCEHTLRICYAFRDLIYTSGESSLSMVADMAYKSIHGILCMENMLEREQAVLVFQAMIYALKEFVDNSQAIGSDQMGVSLKLWLGTEYGIAIPHVLYATLIGLQTLIKRYRINWNESIDTTCIVNIVAFVLENPNLTDNLAVQALKLIQLSIEYFLSPNMALLLDNLQGSGLLCLGPIIVKRLHDLSWEVRDSALELTTSIADISRCKFPAFQQFLHDFKLCSIVSDMLRNDSETYVRASALKCLSKMVVINVIWENDLNGQELIDYLFFILSNESEGLVRKESVKVLTVLYEHHKIPSKYLNYLYSVISYCILSDLDWEVKAEALHFWELEFQEQFTNQGMIDGTFPTVTFSKDNKKIVTLTRKEINLRIMKVFQELSQRGCLGVLLKCLKEEYEREVLKSAVCMVRRLFEQLKNYDYESIIDDMDKNDQQNSNEPKSTNVDNAITSDMLQTEISGLNNQQSDAVIEAILYSQDINLLAASYEKQLQLNNGSIPKAPICVIDEHLYKNYTYIGPKQFIDSIKQMDLNQMLKSHQDWFAEMESFSSLLDDIIVTIREENEALFADCY
uniref:Uncharacterized protein n=1 Tax=Glossina brevipalpis TaxID=37001 RepID=A0A1A9W9D7_9MUSC